MFRPSFSLLLLLNLLLLLVGCGPRERGQPLSPSGNGGRQQETQGEDPAGEGSIEGAPGWRELENRIPRLEQRIQQTLDLLHRCRDLKARYDKARGRERNSLKDKIEGLFGQAGDIFDRIASEADDVQTRSGRTTGNLMDAGPRLRTFSRKWQRLSKPLRRLAFR